MPGSGKSTLGRAVAARLGSPFEDTDKVIERRKGCSVAALFAAEGEQAFRNLETAVLTELVDTGAGVIATGGGVVLREENRGLLRRRTRCVYLRASTRFLWKRLRRDRRRPLLQVADPEARLRELSEEREPLYRETAAIVVDIDDQPFDRLVEDIMQRLAQEAER
jgi:shikimate kinase